MYFQFFPIGCRYSRVFTFGFIFNLWSTWVVFLEFCDSLVFLFPSYIKGENWFFRGVLPWSRGYPQVVLMREKSVNSNGQVGNGYLWHGLSQERCLWCVYGVVDYLHVFGSQDCGCGGGSRVFIMMAPSQLCWRHSEVNWVNRVVLFGPNIESWGKGEEVTTFGVILVGVWLLLKLMRFWVWGYFRFESIRVGSFIMSEFCNVTYYIR